MTAPHRLALIAILAAAGCTAHRPVGLVQPPAARPFVITFWCGPPLAKLDDARAEEIAAAGFTVVGPPCEGTIDREGNLHVLEVAARHRLGVWISDPRITGVTQGSQWEPGVDAAIADYRLHPALDGYFIQDEPDTPRFDVLACVAARLHAGDPGRMAYVNLLPDFVVPDKLCADSYDDYVERFLTTVQPQLLSYDYYPFLKDKDRPGFFTNLATMRALAARYHVPFMLIVQAMPHGPYRDPTEAELAWQVFHALAFGAQGVSYFAYWTPANVPDAERLKFHYGLIEQGKPTLHYFQAARLNRAVRAIAAQLSGLRSLAVADSVGEIAPSFPFGPIEAIDGGAITAGLFGNDAGELAALLVNRDYRYGVTARLRLRSGAVLPEVFATSSQRWSRATTPDIALEPGGARLLRWE